MHPDVMYMLAKQKIAEEHAWAERERRARLVRRSPSPDAVSFGEPIQHLSFSARVRALIESLRPGGGVAAGTTGA